jgi:hypothetical protein
VNKLSDQILRAEHKIETGLKIDIADNTLKHSVGENLVSRQQLQKIDHERLHTGGCGSLKFYIFITENDQTTIKMQTYFFPSFPTLSVYSSLCYFFPKSTRSTRHHTTRHPNKSKI